MILILRFIGVMNAAIWFGAAVFFTFTVGPAFFTPEMVHLLPSGYNGFVAQLVLARYFIMHDVCGVLAIAHLIAEWAYLGRTLSRFTLWLLVAVLSFTLLGGLWLSPKLKQLHLIKYARPELVAPQAREEAGHSFKVWHGVSQVMNLFVLAGLGVYFWRISNPSDSPRFVSATKFRS